MSKNLSLNLAGTYICDGYDIHDGPFNGSRLILSLDQNCCDIEHGYTAYQIQGFGSDNLLAYIGSIVANGNNFAMSFKNIHPEGEADHGVIIGVATHDKDSQGMNRTVLHSYYYQPQYKGGGFGTAICVKQRGECND